MQSTDEIDILDMIERLARLAHAQSWGADLNPAQRAALSYLARANRFSRTPSVVANYLDATRGTVSQTLKALARKGLIAETRSDTDRRSIRYDITPAGEDALAGTPDIALAISALSGAEKTGLKQGLQAALAMALSQRGSRGFGICKTCRHHDTSGANPYCSLLQVALTSAEAEEMCGEHEARA